MSRRKHPAFDCMWLVSCMQMISSSLIRKVLGQFWLQNQYLFSRITKRKVRSYSPHAARTLGVLMPCSHCIQVMRGVILGLTDRNSTLSWIQTHMPAHNELLVKTVSEKRQVCILFWFWLLIDGGNSTIAKHWNTQTLRRPSWAKTTWHSLLVLKLEIHI